MKKISLVTISALVSTASLGFMETSRVAAAYCNGVETAVNLNCASGSDGISGILMYIINFLSVGVVIAVVGGIAWGGLTYARSDGEPAVTKQAIEMIRNAIIALVLFMILWSAANFLIPGGAFNTNKTTTTGSPIEGGGGGSGGGGGAGSW